MPINIFDNLGATNLAAYIETFQPQPIPLLGEAFFPVAKRANISLEWLTREQHTTVALQASAFDTKPNLRTRDGYTDVKTKLPFFREALQITEQQRQDLIDFATMSNHPRTIDILRDIYDDAKTLVDSAMIVPEIMRMKLLTDARFTFSAENVNGQPLTYAYNYDADGAWAANNKTTLTGTALWTTQTANPVADIMTMKRKAQNNGVAVTKILMNSTTFGYICQNQNVINMIANPNIALNFVSDEDVKNFIRVKTGLEIIVYDKTYKLAQGTATIKSMIDDGKVVFLPDNQLGTTWYARTPEEIDAMDGQVQGAEIAIVNTGVAILTLQKKLPSTITTSVSQLVLPSYENINQVYTLVAA